MSGCSATTRTEPQNGSAIIVDNNTALATDHASITNLVGGGFVVAWEQSAAAGGAHSVWFQLYNASGVRVTVPGDALNSHHLIDSSGSINQDIQAAALQDGGFVVVYADNGWIVSRYRDHGANLQCRWNGARRPYPGQHQHRGRPVPSDGHRPVQRLFHSRLERRGRARLSGL